MSVNQEVTGQVPVLPARLAPALGPQRPRRRELEDTHGIRRDDRSSWRQIPGDLKAAKRDTLQAGILTGRSVLASLAQSAMERPG